MVAISVNAVFRDCMMPIKIECDCGQRYVFDVEPVNGRMPTRVACPTCGTDGTATANDHIARLFPSVPAPSPVIQLIELPAQSRTVTATEATVEAPARASAPAPVARAVQPLATAAPATLPLATVAAPPASAALTPSAPRLSVAASPVHRAAPALTPGRPDPRLGLVDRTQAEHEARAKVMWGDTKEQIVSYLMVQGFSAPEANELATKLFQERTAAVRSNGIGKIIKGVGLMCVPIVALLIFLSIGVIPMKVFGLTIMVGLYGFYLFVKGVLMAVAPKSEQGDVADQ
jgi:hypothetical protein